MDVVDDSPQVIAPDETAARTGGGVLDGDGVDGHTSALRAALHAVCLACARL